MQNSPQGLLCKEQAITVVAIQLVLIFLFCIRCLVGSWSRLLVGSWSRLLVCAVAPVLLGPLSPHDEMSLVCSTPLVFT